jgi:hypothetical protein
VLKAAVEAVQSPDDTTRRVYFPVQTLPALASEQFDDCSHSIMCRKPYRGFACGHGDPEATPLAPEPCGPPDRQSCEPLCQSLTWKLIYNGKPKCPSCRKLMSELWEDWQAAEADLKARNVPQDAISHIDGTLGDMYKVTFTRAHKDNLGPHHTEHTCFRPTQVGLIQSMMDFCDRLADVDKCWSHRLDALIRTKQVPAKEVSGIMQQRACARSKATPDQLGKLIQAEVELLRCWHGLMKP